MNKIVIGGINNKNPKNLHGLNVCSIFGAKYKNVNESINKLAGE